MPMTSPSDEAYFIRTTWVLFSLGTLFALLRLSIKFHISRHLYLEEYIVIFSLLCWAGDTACIPFIVLHGTNSMPPSFRLYLHDKPESTEYRNRVTAGKLFVFAWALYITMIWGLKASILLFYKRVTSRLREQRVIVYAWYVLGASWLACELSMVFVCRPFKGNWQIWPNPGNGHEYVWIVGILNILTDVMLLMIPLPMVFRLQVSLSRKILLGGLFGLGLFVIVATILRIYFTIAGGNISNMTFWSMIETCTAMIVANCPGIRAIFTRKRKQDEWMNNNAGRSAGAAGGAATYNSHELSSDRPSPCRSKDIISQSSDSSLTLNTNMPIPRSILSSTIKQSLSKYGRRAGGGKDGNSTRVEIGNSTDRIVDVENGNPMVIHQRVEYFVNGRAASPRELEEVRFDAKRAAR